MTCLKGLRLSITTRYSDWRYRLEPYDLFKGIKTEHSLVNVVGDFLLEPYDLFKGIKTSFKASTYALLCTS